MRSARSCVTPQGAAVDEPGTLVALKRPVRDPSRHGSVARQQGFTLVEALVVVTIVGLISAAIAISINTYWQRSRLEGAANEVRNFLLTAQNLAIATNDRVTVQLQQQDGAWVLSMVPSRPPAAGSLLDVGMRTRLELPRFLVLNGLGVGDGTSTDWLEFPSGVRNVVCTSLSRTQEQTAATAFADISTSRFLRLTHQAIVDGRLFPRTVFEIQISPLWNVRIVRRRAA